MKIQSTLVVLLSACLIAASAHAAQPRPNVVVFLADDLGWRDLGYAGSTFYETPNIDALAKRGMAFTSASYSACAVCSPTRAALMTGRWPARVGVTDFIGGPQPKQAATQPRFRNRTMLPAAYFEQLPRDEVTVAEALREAGYATACAGKWHLGGRKFPPTGQGFDEAFDFPKAAPAGGAGEYPGLQLARKSADWIATQTAVGKPFFLYFASHDPHIPLLPPKDAIDYFQAKRQKLKLTNEFAQEGKSKVRQTQADPTYAAVIKMLDDAVGIVVDRLVREKLLDNTIIVFTSDNGGLSTAEGIPTSNLPLRAGKGWAYEGGVRVPLIWCVPRVTTAGATSDVATVSTDLFPTLLAACGLADRPREHLDGISILPALRAETLPPRDLFWHYPHYGNQGGQPYSAIRSPDGLKLIVFHDPARSSELYDLSADPGEKTDLATTRPQDVKALRAKLNAWKGSVKAVDATPKP